MADIWLTPEEIKKREARLEYLKGPRRLEIAGMTVPDLIKELQKIGMYQG